MQVKNVIWNMFPLKINPVNIPELKVIYNQKIRIIVYIKCININEKVEEELSWKVSNADRWHKWIAMQTSKCVSSNSNFLLSWLAFKQKVGSVDYF